MLPDNFFQVLQHEGVVAIATQGKDGMHLINTWNSYIQVTKDERLLIPVGGMNKTQKNVSENNRVLLTMGTRAVPGDRGRNGTGFLISGTASFVSHGADYDLIKGKFPWARAALNVAVGNITQTL